MYFEYNSPDLQSPCDRSRAARLGEAEGETGASYRTKYYNFINS